MRTVTIPKADYSRMIEYNDTYFMRYSPVENDDIITAQEVVTVLPKATYSTLVSALIHTKYSIDDELAILANHADDPQNEEHLAIYNEYQAWRTEVKSVCHEWFNI